MPGPGLSLPKSSDSTSMLAVSSNGYRNPSQDLSLSQLVLTHVVTCQAAQNKSAWRAQTWPWLAHIRFFVLILLVCCETQMSTASCLIKYSSSEHTLCLCIFEYLAFPLLNSRLVFKSVADINPINSVNSYSNAKMKTS